MAEGRSGEKRQASLRQGGESCGLLGPRSRPASRKCSRAVRSAEGDRAQGSRHTFFSCSEKEIATCHPQGEKAATLKSPSFQQDRFPSVLVTFRPNELP